MKNVINVAKYVVKFPMLLLTVLCILGTSFCRELTSKEYEEISKVVVVCLISTYLFAISIEL